MISHLRATKAATFHKLRRPLSNNAIADLFRKIRAAQIATSNNIIDERRRVHGKCKWSAIAVSYERIPSFLDDATNVRDKITGYLLLVEYRGIAVVFKSRLDLPSTFVSSFFSKLTASSIDGAIARVDATFEKLRLRNMSISKLALRNKTLEGNDLEYAVGPAGASRYVPQGYTVRNGADHFSATPSTGRISQRSDRVEYEVLLDFAVSVVDELLSRSTNPSPFIQTFARPVDLGSIAGASHPTALSIDISTLVEEIYEAPKIRLVKFEGDNYVNLSQPEAAALFEELNETFSIVGAGKLLDIVRTNGGVSVGSIAINKNRIALRELNLPLTQVVEVESVSHDLGEDQDRLSLRRYLDQKDAFIVLFNELTLAYIDGTLYRDSALSAGGGTFLHYLRTEPLLAPVVSEKGAFAATQTHFDANSTFGVIAQSIAKDDSVLVCDDLGDEWADFIGLNKTSNPPQITFYHAKHGELSLGAGPFHVSVSQAIKNLGRMTLSTTAVRQKLAIWGRNYHSGGGVQTRIARLIRGNAAALEEEFSSVAGAPDAIRRVFIVTSSLSRSAVKDAFDDIQAGNAASPHFVQLYWLLMSFFSACNEVGAYGYVVCRE